ncbi:hypothetical protein ISN45_At04g014840 [Arabidopsis thaliana x Arabidopsis arenosa]|uniref:Uncharacterized protein n=1 Tax=Arabidopsis thaliana x Arabidopsis arenosa TaxID=1240361 RepID=A0A8T2DVK5_9BRAS|nr:hypothetical protein ISN45_At04g014840 [Arabidopsis thaliana x Arabidopsis arenosa]
MDWVSVGVLYGVAPLRQNSHNYMVGFSEAK